jgi:hypothetical protein
MNTQATIEEPVSKQRFGKHIIDILMEMFPVRSVQSGYKKEFSSEELIEFRSSK